VPLPPGMAAVDVHVVAEPKRGLDPAFNDPGSQYGPGGAVGAFQQIDYEHVQTIVVWMETSSGERGRLPAPPDTTVTIGQQLSGAVKGVATVGKVVFKNERDAALSVYSVSDGNTFDLGSIAPGQQGEYVVASPGLVEVLTESRSEPIARLYAVQSPWVQTINSGEHAWFTNLPPGGYRAGCWHERLPGSAQAVDLMADQIARVSLTLSVNLLPEKR
jgi:hypothetical protein